MKQIFLAACVFFSICTTAQTTTKTEGGKEVTYTHIDEMPKAGYDLNAYLAGNLHYPDSARAANVTGRVIIKFVVNEDGAISNATVVRGIGGGCDAEAVRVVSGMPKWIPGKNKGRPAKVFFTIPINFRLTDEKPDSTPAGQK